MAAALGVSSFTLVYHFGTRAELVRAIIGAIATRQRGFETLPEPEDVTLDAYLGGLRRTFELTLLPRNRALQRLEFEAQMLEAVERTHILTRSAHEELQCRVRDVLIALGLNPANAAVESRLFIDTFYGIQVGLVINAGGLRVGPRQAETGSFRSQP